MIHNFNYHWTTHRYLGSECIDQLGGILKKDGAHVVLLHYGSGEYLTDTGLLERIKMSLCGAGLSYAECSGLVPNPRLSKVEEGVAICKAENVDYILAIGGGSAVDSAKAISLGVKYGGDVWDLFTGKGKVSEDEEIIPISAVVTYPATGAEAGWTSVVRNEHTLEKRIVRNAKARPHYAFMNPRYTLTLPRWLLVNGICDIMSHHTDRYMTDDAHFGLFDNLLESAMHYLHSELAPIILDSEKDNLVDRTELMAVADVAVDEFIAWGRNKENASHNIAHQIGALYDTIHGSTLTIVYASWLPYVYKDNVARVARWAVKVWDVEPDPNNLEKVAEQGIERLLAWFKELGLPTRFSDIGIYPTDEEITRMADMVLESSKKGYVGVIKKLYRDDLINIYKNAL